MLGELSDVEFLLRCLAQELLGDAFSDGITDKPEKDIFVLQLCIQGCSEKFLHFLEMLLRLLELFLAVTRGPLGFRELLHLMNDK